MFQLSTNVDTPDLIVSLFLDRDLITLSIFIRDFKAVLLHNGNSFPSIPIDHSVYMKEPYENVKILFQELKYEEHN